VAGFVIDTPPASLLRAYTVAEHAEALLARGGLRLRRIEYYRTIEDLKRQDSAEGEAHLKVPGDVTTVQMDRASGGIVGQSTAPGHLNWQMSFQNPTYALCLSHPAVDISELTARFGTHVIEVVQPKQFLRRLHLRAQALRLPNRTVDFVDCFPVRYDKGLVGAAPDDPSEIMRLSYGQKTPDFAVEREYRCVVVLSGPSARAPDYLDLELGDVRALTRRYTVVGRAV